MKIRSDGTIVFVVIVIIIFSVINYSFSEKSYKEGYVAANHEFMEEHFTSSYEDFCDGSCEHVKEAIENLIEEGELVDADSIFDRYNVYSEEDLQKAYMEGMAEGYVQGYGDCFYGNKKELDISEYSDEEYYYE